MKKIIFAFVLLFAAGISQAQVAKYTYKPFNKEGCRVEFFVTSNNGKLHLVIDVKSDEGLAFSQEPVCQLRFGNGETLKIEGTNLGFARTSSETVVYSNYASNTTSSYGRAVFLISEEEAENFKSGIVKIRLTTVPFVHERTFDPYGLKGSIGEDIYKAYLKEKNKEENF